MKIETQDTPDFYIVKIAKFLKQRNFPEIAGAKDASKLEASQNIDNLSTENDEKK